MLLYQVAVDGNFSVPGGIGGSEVLITFNRHEQRAVFVERHGPHTLFLLSVLGNGNDAIPGTAQRPIMLRLVRNIIQRSAASHLAFISVGEGTYNQRAHIDAHRCPAARKLVALLQMYPRDSLVQQIADIETFRSAHLETGSKLVAIHLPVPNATSGSTT